MKNLSKVIWSEGMSLGVHHFQAQNRYFEDLLHFTVSSLWFQPYGFLGFELDADALRNGTVSVLHARGVFPDGLPFHIPESDLTPTPRDIRDDFPPTQQTLRVMLAIPEYKPEGLNCEVPGNGSGARVRFVSRPLNVTDENTGRDEKALQLGQKNIGLLLENENPEGLITLPIARVTRDGSGHFVYDREFIPPCLEITASEKLIALTRRLIDELEERGASLSGVGAEKGGKFSAGLSARDVAGFWYLHAINSSLAPLRHIYLARRGHPEALFLELSRLAGALCTFRVDSHPSAIPLYDHLNLEKCFHDLEVHIRTHLATIFPENCVSIPLKPVAHYLYDGEIKDQRCLDRARWILSIRADLGEVELLTRTTQLVKVCSSQFVPELIKRALPGLTLTHLPVPPAAVSPKVTNQYFAINRSGPCWEHMVKTRRVGIYVPGEIPNPDLELLVLLEM